MDHRHQSVLTVVCLCEQIEQNAPSVPTCSLSPSPVRNALVVVAATLVAFSWDAFGHQVFTITGDAPTGLPPFRPPPTSAVTANGTIVSFGEIVKVPLH